MGHAVRDALGQRGVVAHSFFSEQALDGNPKKLDDSSAQQAYALLTLLADPKDRVALRCWCGFGSSTLNENGWSRLRTYCVENAETPRQALEDLVTKTIKIPYTSAVVERFKLLRRFEEDLRLKSGHELADLLFPEAEGWSEPLRSIVKQKFPANMGFTPSELVDEIRTGVTQMDTPTDVDYVPRDEPAQIKGPYCPRRYRNGMQ